MCITELQITSTERCTKLIATVNNVIKKQITEENNYEYIISCTSVV